ncbi:sugar transferase [Luteolibacter pohnpeiensis]|uniref:Sugar transferase n=1 Tax=Luteolibacter pohnpeiensis TaxID=454153 RepID=A0A934SAT5_9BACT|nr:sugar transferase [Luteolibacter pohnpeiensis]MBK1882489.1 sugar transferase [Luteolibacter pohnpeiensis]
MALSRKESFVTQVLQLLDAFLVWLAFWIGGEIRDVIRGYMGLGVEDEAVWESMRWVLLIAVPFTPLVLERFRFYNRLRLKTTRAAVWQLIQALLVIGLLISMIAVFAKLIDARRLILGTGLIAVFLLLLARDRLTKVWLNSKSLRESDKERILLAGSEEGVEEFLDQVDPEVLSSWNIVDRFDLTSRSVDDLFQLLKGESVGRVIFSAKHTEFDKVAQAVEACELQGVEAWISASFIRSQIARPVFDAVGSKPMLVLRSTPELSWELMFKGLIDIVGAAALLTLALPFCIVAAIGIKITSPGAPVLFSQMRAGSYGKPFRMWKFRTMVANAEELLQKIKEDHGNQMDGPVFKLDRDPRIFPFGAFLRKLSIDEIPQLLNVLLGDMSLVGPRPLPLYEVDAFCEISHRRRLSMKPGITCVWQAGGRNKITNFDEWVKMDLDYIDNWSLWLDFKILVKTIPAVLLGKGAK